MIIERANKISNWVSYEILKSTDKVKTLKKFILVLKELQNLNNFSGLMSIFGGLTINAVFRLKKTWGQLSHNYKEIFDEIFKVAEFDNNFKKLRTEIKNNSNEPVVPYIGIFLSDLLKIEENSDFFKDKKIINFQKRRLLYDIIISLKSLQKKKYDLTVIYYFNHSLFWSYTKNC
jgi:hypothetical protein